MNTSTLNRSVLAVMIGTVLAAGVAAPAHAQAWGQRHAAQDQSASSSTAAQDDADAREARRKAHEDAKKAREEADKAREQRDQAQQQRAQEQQREEAQQQRAQMQQEREQAQQDRGQAQQERVRDQQQREWQAQREQQEQVREQDRQARERNDQLEREQAQAQREQAREQRNRDEERQPREQNRDDYAQARDQQREDRQQQRDDRQQQRGDRVQDRQQDRSHADLPPARRVENRVRDQRIVRDREQAKSFQQAIQTQIAPQAKSYANTLYSQHRSYGYNYQQQYYWRLLQMLTSWGWNSYNYYNDPYYQYADDYRYYRGGSWYGVNRYGADVLRQAVNYGYQEGFYAGRADNLDGWRYDYRGAWVYRDANYGYRGFYVSQYDYNYYFREGFRRGYEDGYYQRYRYGRSYNGSDVILGSVMSGILNLQAYRW